MVLVDADHQIFRMILCTRCHLAVRVELIRHNPFQHCLGIDKLIRFEGVDEYVVEVQGEFSLSLLIMLSRAVL